MLQSRESFETVDQALGLAIHVEGQVKRQILEWFECWRDVLAGGAHQITQEFAWKSMELSGKSEKTSASPTCENLVYDAVAGIVLLSLRTLAEVNVQQIQGSDEELVGVLLLVARQMTMNDSKCHWIPKKKPTSVSSHLAFFQIKYSKS
jgi:hypothetical protein